MIEKAMIETAAAADVYPPRLYVRSRLWAAISMSWIILLLFSSTSAAERYCEVALHRMMSLVFGQTENDSSADEDHFWAKKATHVVLYVCLAGTVARAAGGSTTRVRLLVIGAGLATGIGTEFVQSFFPDREPTVRDVVIDVVSTWLGSALFIRGPRRDLSSHHEG